MKAGRWASAVLLAAVAFAGCAPTYSQGKGEKFENLTLNNLMKWPGGTDYIEAAGSGRPPDGEKDPQKRRLASRNEAVLAAQRQLIAQLVRLAPREKVRELLRKAEVGKLEFTYDDGCNVVLRLPREAARDARPIE